MFQFLFIRQEAKSNIEEFIVRGGHIVQGSLLFLIYCNNDLQKLTK